MGEERIFFPKSSTTTVSESFSKPGLTGYTELRKKIVIKKLASISLKFNMICFQ